MNSGYFPRTPPPPPGQEVRVVRHPRGWAVIRVGNVRPSRVTPDRERAILIAKGYAHEERSTWTIEDEEQPAHVALGTVDRGRASGE